jgi:transcriptional regulator with XRE-family HTH domain
MVSLVAKLHERQLTLNLSDSEMAERLGISRQMWSFTKNGRRWVGFAILQGIVRGFPELSAEALFFLRSDVTEITDDVSTITESPQTRQDRQGVASGRVKAI